VIRVAIPHHLRNLARTGPEVEVEVVGPVTIGAVLDALEAKYPMLRGTIREHGSLKRRAFVRFFACGEDVSFAPPGTELPSQVAEGAEPFMVVGAIAGG
jgi:hypothetical protein